MSKLSSILPFLGDDDLKELAVKIINKEVTGIKLVMLFPFLNSSDLDEIVDLMIEKNFGRQLTTVLPFASKKTIEKISNKIKDGTVTGVHEAAMYPFLGEEALKARFADLLKEAGEHSKDDDEDDDLDDLDDLDNEK